MTDAENIARVYGDTVPIRIPAASHCAMLWAHFQFAPLAEPECEFNGANEPLTPGLLGYLRGIPVYYSPVKSDVTHRAERSMDERQASKT